jgi:hypothetical protein
MTEKLELDDGQTTTILLDGVLADVSAGGHGHHGDVVLEDAAGHERIRLGRIVEPVSSSINVKTSKPTVGQQSYGYSGLRLRSHGGANIATLGQVEAPPPTTTKAEAEATPASPVTLHLGTDGAHGLVVVSDEKGDERVRLDGQGAAGRFELPPLTDDAAIDASTKGLGDAVSARAAFASALSGHSDYGAGVSAASGQFFGVLAQNEQQGSFGALAGYLTEEDDESGYRHPPGVIGEAAGVGVWGNGAEFGVMGQAVSELSAGKGVSVPNGVGLYGKGGEYGVWAVLDSYAEVEDGYPGPTAGEFWGPVRITGDLWVLGTKHFVIDHPLDPANKYLVHSSVESDERLNVYSGTAALDDEGKALVEVPDWLEALNADVRYQLTPIGTPAPDLHVAHELESNRFAIAGGRPGMKVSWQLTGVRRDMHAQAHAASVEIEKGEDARGKLLHPADHGAPEDRAVYYERHARLRQIDRARPTLAARTGPDAGGNAPRE